MTSIGCVCVYEDVYEDVLDEKSYRPRLCTDEDCRIIGAGGGGVTGAFLIGKATIG